MGSATERNLSNLRREKSGYNTHPLTICQDTEYLGAQRAEMYSNWEKKIKKQ